MNATGSALSNEVWHDHIHLDLISENGAFKTKQKDYWFSIFRYPISAKDWCISTTSNISHFNRKNAALVSKL